MPDLEKRKSGLSVPKAEPSAREKIEERAQWAFDVIDRLGERRRAQKGATGFTFAPEVSAALVTEMMRQDAVFSK